MFQGVFHLTSKSFLTIFLLFVVLLHLGSILNIDIAPEELRYVYPMQW
jgi:hypothetical protein